MTHESPNTELATGQLSVGQHDLAASVYRSHLLDSVPQIQHGLTNRVAGLGLADGNVGFSPPRDQADAWAMRQRWCAAIGVDPGTLVTLGQVHGAEVVPVSGAEIGIGARPGSGRVGLGDAMITDSCGVTLMTLHADCLPILLFDPDRPAIAAVHAGWRGTIADVPGNTVRTMTAAFGTDPRKVMAFLGPAIGPCCYEVGAEVVAAWRQRAETESTAVAVNGHRMCFDLRTANLELLARAGLNGTLIESSTICTRCDGERWFSHRSQGPDTGRFGAIISLAG